MDLALLSFLHQAPQVQVDKLIDFRNSLVQRLFCLRRQVDVQRRVTFRRLASVGIPNTLRARIGTSFFMNLTSV